MRFRYILLLASVIAMATGHAAHAAPESMEQSGFSLHGFGTLGIARSDNEEVEYVRDLSQPDGLTEDWSGKIDSVLGLQASYRFNAELEGVLQAISRYRYDGSYRPEISWAFLRYDPNPSFSLRAGRMGTEFYMLADSRLVGYSNLTVRPPPDFFHSLIFSYFDGVDVSATTPVAGGLLRGKLFAGLSPETSPFAENLTWDLDGSLMLGGHLDYLTGPWQLRLSHARIRFENEQPLNALVAASFPSLPTSPSFLEVVPELAMVDTWSSYTSLGVVYDEGPLQIQLMLNRIDHESAFYEDSKAGYITAGYRLGSFTPYLGYSRVKSSANQLAPTPYDPLPASLVAQTHADQNTLFLGVRWDFRPDLALKAQVDRINAGSGSILPFRGDTDEAGGSGDMTVYSLALDFVF